MRKSRSEAEQTRQRIVTTASRLIRGKGIAGVGVAELMKQSGLTHGGFYKHFPSKDALMGEACKAALEETREGLAETARKARKKSGLQAIVDNYLSPEHRDHPERGCVIAATGDEAVRGHDSIRDAVAGGADNLVNLVAAQLPDLPVEEARAEARGIVASMIGAMIMARAMGNTTDSDSLLADVRRFVLG